MKTCSCLIALWAMLALNAWCQDAATDQKQLDGKWLPKSGEFLGMPYPEERLKMISLDIMGDRYTAKVGDVVDKGTTKRDASKKPKTMDIVGTEGPSKGKTILAIYELNGDTLRVCYDLGGKGRPAEFKTTKDAIHLLVVYQRAKP